MTAPVAPAAEATAAQALEAAAQRLAAAGVAGPRRDARLLLAHALEVPDARLLAEPETAVNAGAAARFEALLARRAAREPVSRILGRRDFWSLDLAVTPAVLDPRPETETLVEAMLARIADRTAPLRVLDLGTGSGCLLLALLSELPNARGLGLERDPEAAAVARANAARHGLQDRAEVRQDDWSARGPEARFDVVVANPPYVATGEIDRLAPEVAGYDPRGALDGGADGLAAYRDLAPRLPGWLAAHGLAALEVGRGQADEVQDLLQRSGLHTPIGVCDLAGDLRCVLARPG